MTELIHNIVLDCWEDFITHVDQIQRRQSTDPDLYGSLLFRGHPNAQWQLSTTLDRAVGKKLTLLGYYRLVASIRPEIESLTGNQWAIPGYQEFEKLIGECDLGLLRATLGASPAYGYMAHLRHHQFPSPLLDWTHSAYVAAFFAFQNAGQDANVSIYVLSEARMHSSSSDEPTVLRFGPNVRTHRRHFLQQSEYTICLVYDSEHREWTFAPHEPAIKNEDHLEEHPCNFALHKFDIPCKERVKVLKLLDAYNLNAYSLFGSEEALMNTIAMRKFDMCQS
jgi:hypothetical protein